MSKGRQVQNLILHKVKISHETAFDYEEGVGDRPKVSCEDCGGRCGRNWNNPCINDIPNRFFPKAEYKDELEYYIQQNKAKHNSHYFRTRYFDEELQQELMLFIRKKGRLAIMQNWEILGVMVAADWDIDLEEYGFYKRWYNTPVFDVDVEYDFVVEINCEKQLEKIEEKLEEVLTSEWKQRRRVEHDRQFNKKNLKKSQKRLVEIIESRENLESEQTVIRERLSRLKGAARVFR